MGVFLDAFQKVADLANNSHGNYFHYLHRLVTQFRCLSSMLLETSYAAVACLSGLVFKNQCVGEGLNPLTPTVVTWVQL